MENETLEQLLLDEFKVVFKYLIKMGASKEDAEDIVQETLYKVLKNIDAVHQDRIRAWLFKVAINSYYNLYSKKKRSSEYIGTLSNMELFAESVEDQIVSKERNNEIYEALDLLKPSYKNLLVLKYFLNLPYKDIADILEMSESNVKVYLYRARNKFKEIWEGLS
ncbi:MAG: sigma-70 family RNA polymerase sigma factor [Bacillota bacterium]|nr:sigma-70 family RNA polymerase sigma factor [Bacillota bacterium]